MQNFYAEKHGVYGSYKPAQVSIQEISERELLMAVVGSTCKDWTGLAKKGSIIV